MKTKLSVNINKIASLRNARGGNIPDVLLAAKKIEAFGAEGITVHPRPDERHIRYNDVWELKKLIKTELNVEGKPTPKFMDLVLEVLPDQVTLVPDKEDAITSNAGWDTKSHLSFLSEIIQELKSKNIRVSIFLDPKPELVEYAKKAGADRIELYTEAFAIEYANGKIEKSIVHYKKTALLAKQLGLGVNAGHDLDLNNLEFLITEIPFVSEVSIGHALVSDALYLGLENTVQAYLKRIENGYRKANPT